MGFDIAIYNGFTEDVNKVVNSVKAAYLYADKVRVYDHIIPLGFNTDEIRAESMEERVYHDKYRVFDDPSNFGPYEFDANGKLQKIADPLSYKAFLDIHKKCTNILEDRSYINLCENLECRRKNNSSSYSTLIYQKELSRINVELVTPINERRLSPYSLVELSFQFNDKFVEDKGFKILNDHLYKANTLIPSMWTPTVLSEYSISSLPGFEDATVDEIIDIKKELEKYIIPYRAAMLRIAQDIKEIPGTESFQRECLLLYLSEIEPKVASINAAIIDNNVFKNIAKSFLTEKETWVSIGAMVVALSTSGNIASAISMGAAVAMGGLSMSKGITKTMEERRKIKDNEMYFLYETGNKLRINHNNREQAELIKKYDDMLKTYGCY